MNKRRFERYWIWLGLILGFTYPLGYATIPKISLEVVSVFFAGLLAIVSILPAIENHNNIKFVKESGHYEDLIDFIYLPLKISFTLILLEFLHLTLTIEIIPIYFKNIFGMINLALWGVFLLAIFRILQLIPKLINDKKQKKNIE